MESPYKIAEWTIDPKRGLAVLGKRETHLEPKAVELLGHFARHPGQVMSRTDLLDAVWPDVTVGDEVITNTIAKLRRVFDDDPKAPTFIETVPKRGYRLVAPVHIITEPASPTTEPAPVHARVRPLLVLLAGLLVIGGLWWLADRPPPPSPSTSPAAVAPRTGPSIAVLPFVNMSRDEEQEYFSDGLTEDLITDLSKIAALTVISRTSTFAYKSKTPDVRTLARELGVTHVVEGSVRRADGKVRITAQLIDAATGNHLWAERYDRDLTDIFELQDDVRNKIVTALAITLSPEEQRRLSRHVSSNPEAYDLYLQGLQQESYFTRDNNANAQALFVAAIERDPGFAAAHAHLGQTYSLSVENRWTDDEGRYRQKALNAARRGVALDPDLPYAHWSLGRILTRPYIGEQETAKMHFQKAVALNPNFADGYLFLAYTYIYTGEAARALPLIEKAMRINPHFPFWYWQALGMVQFFMGNAEASVQSLQKAIERNPNVPWLRRHLIASYGLLGRTDDAAWELSEVESLGQPTTIDAFMDALSVKDETYRHMYRQALHRAGMTSR